MSVAVGVIDALAIQWAPRFGGAAWIDRVTGYAAAAQRAHLEDAFNHSAAIPGLAVSVYVDAMACWVLHWCVLAELEDAGFAGAGGPVTAQRTGDESVAFQQSSGASGAAPGDAHFTRTSWGQRYLGYRNSRPDAHMFVI